ncbi:MAG: hypothetical protein ACM3U2_12480, partial [Deltaproteobacteria bacterium]
MIDPRIWVFGIYVSGLVGLAAWWLVGFAALRRVLRAARPAPEWCHALLRAIAGPAADRVRLLASSRAGQPFTFGWRRAVIVLPEEMLRPNASAEEQLIPLNREAQPRSTSIKAELRWSLAHEWAHIVGGDVRAWSLAGLVRTIYFYQPLCWWLRAQLRLCQDYLADAAAARETSPEAYAEFLATRAAGRPLVYGLGIAGGRSDLCRRVTMLVKPGRALETRCPRWWSAAAACAAIVLVFVAATFGEKRPVATAGYAPRTGPAAADEKNQNEENAAGKESGAKNTGAVKPEAGKAATKSAKAAPAKVEKESDNEARKKLLEGLFARATAIKSGRFTARVEWGPAKLGAPSAPARGRRGRAGTPASGMMGPMMMGGRGGMGSVGGPNGPPREIELIVAGESWLLRPGPSHETVFINHSSHSFSFSFTDGPRALNADKLTIDRSYPAGSAQFSGLPVPLRAGTIWYPQSVAYLREHAAAARLTGKARVNGAETQALEWTIPAPDAEAAFADAESTAGLLAGGGTYRVYVSPQLDYAVARIECVDRFGTAQSMFDFSQFKKVAEGIYLPQRIEIREGAGERSIDVLSISKINEPIDDREFVLPVPPGTQVEDVRPHAYDNFRPAPGPRYDPNQHRLRNFTTGAEYPEGLPAAMLEEMDRDVLSPEEARTRQAQARPPTQKVSDQKIAEAPPSKTTAAGQAATPRRQFTYGGKSLDTWAEELLGDLEPETRVKALEALKSFAANGHAEEAAAVIAELLKNDGPNEEVGGTVQKVACDALARCGSAGVPVLEAQLGSKSSVSRVNAVSSLAAIVPSTDAVGAALLKAVKDREFEVRMVACRALAQNHLDQPAVADALGQAVHDEKIVRLGIVTGLSESRAGAEPVVALVRKFLDDDDTKVHGIAAAIFAARAPVTEENARALEKAVLDLGSWGRYGFVESLKGQQARVEVRPELIVPILISLLESRESYAELNSGIDIKFAETIIDIIGKMT